MVGRVNTPLRNYFFYKSGLYIGQVLTDGYINFFKDSDHSESGRLDVYQDPALTIPYDNPLKLGDDGGCAPIYMQDEPYYIEVFSVDGELQFTVSNYEGAIFDPGPDTSGEWVNNLFVDGQFNFPDFDGETTAGTESITQSGWQFAKDESGGTDLLEFVKFPLGDPDVVQTPLNYFHYQLTSVASGGVTKAIFYPFKYVRTLENTQVTFSFYARSSSSTVLIPYYQQNFGTGGSPSPGQVVELGNAALTGTWALYSFTTTIDSCAGEDLGTNNDDSLIVGLLFPPNIAIDVSLTNMLLQEGDQATQYPYLTYEQVEAQLPGGGALAGEIVWYGIPSANAPPPGMLDCQGQAVSRSSYLNLYLNTTFLDAGDTATGTGVITNLDTTDMFPGMQLTCANFAEIVTIETVNSATQITVTGGVATASGQVSIRFYLFGAGDGVSTFNVPLLQRRTMVGWGGTSSAMLKNSVGAFGGEELHTMTEAELAPHTHTYTASTSNPKSGTGDPAFCGAATENSGSTGSATPFNVVQPSLVLRPFIRY